MRILAVSDVISDQLYGPGICSCVGDVDCVLSCGDLPLFYLDYIASMLNVPLYYVYGNHDTGYEHTGEGRVRYGVPGGTNLDGRTADYRGLLLAGLEGSRWYRPDGQFQYSEQMMRLKVMALTPQLVLNRVRYRRYLDVLITHAPPFGIHDGPDEPHVGFKVFRRLMRQFRPRYLLHGHQHVYTPDQTTETRFGVTTVINVYPFRVLDVEVSHG